MNRRMFMGMDVFRTRRKDAGFTLSELLIALVVVVVLAAIAVPIWMNQRNKGYDATVRSDLRQIANAIQAADSDGVVSRDGSGKAVWVNYSKVSDLNISNGVAWGVRGTTEAFCLTGYHLRGTVYTPGKALTYDSTAGGLGRTGGACSGTAGDPPPYVAGNGNVAAPGATTQPDPWCPTTCSPTPPLGPGAPNVIINSSFDPSRPMGRITGYFSSEFAMVSENTPVSTQAVKVTSTRADKPQGVIVWPLTPGDDLRSVPHRYIAGEQWAVSAYIKADPSLRLQLGFRSTEFDSGYGGESWCPAVKPTSEWQRLTCVLTVPQSAGSETKVIGMQVTSTMPVGASFLMAGPQLEKSDRPSVFQPTP